MNFIIGLSSSKYENVIYNAIFMIVDKDTKMIKYLLIIIKIDIAKLIKLFFEKIIYIPTCQQILLIIKLYIH